MAFLGLGPDDLRIAAATLRRAQEMRIEREDRLVKNLAIETANNLGKVLAPLFKGG
ncbi:hypothetical protein Back2_17910 [Nocardioides baekrokdamisoli]|uniref:Uncharacterized protein n=1 Tax=Nocardioides baekrokdamisoli TaxID=1804624 RepID=A0A3G9J226_9ACTN|nr:hypothetical protein [Nocardioides baekrokdamisoli]BBH17504.1 hypothetical protein Back2_17910 [Nocardioides baekrokdamisoli]